MNEIFASEFNSINQINLLNNLEEKYFLKLKNDFKLSLEKIDEEVVNSKWRVNKGWIIKERNIKRTIITKFGEVTYKRTKFINKYNGKCSFLADPYMEIEKYQRISFSLEKEILESFNHGESHIIVWEKIKKSNITKRTISNILKRNAEFNFKKLDLTKDEFKNDLPVYVDIDDCWTTVRFKNKKRWIRVRVAVAYQGKIKEGKRNKLINKKVFLKTFLKGNSCNTYDYSCWLQQEIEKNYGTLTNKKFVICGDGANWILEIANFLGAEFVLDKFHLFQKIYFCFPYKRSKNKSKLMKLYELAIEKYDSKNIKSLINFLYENVDSIGLKNKRIKEAIKYISNNIKGIENHFKDWYIGCFAESAVSHLVKSIKGYGAKIYNKKTFELLINLKATKINNIDILEIIYFKFKENLEDQIYDNQKIFISNKSNNLEKRNLKSVKISILDYKKTGYNELIRKLIH
ncbi:Mbov_0401 family ICE element transposase-like protein [Spiroplasma floricola]|uniref:ISKra4 family transposase n=1 Tax=Spiroplasma floricola 23-6 TaxID=1336749 RepID=A0A2K8SF66_9MOLU|nr:UPF0236 family protein [Spiroplasma floricola]AUB31995.1 hypothetical protein SFLOR_v1c09470 [Spiroplasma floricola 23-6]